MQVFSQTQDTEIGTLFQSDRGNCMFYIPIQWSLPSPLAFDQVCIFCSRDPLGYHLQVDRFLSLFLAWREVTNFRVYLDWWLHICLHLGLLCLIAIFTKIFNRHLTLMMCKNELPVFPPLLLIFSCLLSVNGYGIFFRCSAHTISSYPWLCPLRTSPIIPNATTLGAIYCLYYTNKYYLLLLLLPSYNLF